MLKKVRDAKACFEFAPDFIHNIDGEIHFKKCIGNYFNGVWMRFAEMEKNFEKGLLPYPGCLTEQPAKVMEIFRVIASYRHEKMVAEQERMRREERASLGR